MLPTCWQLPIWMCDTCDELGWRPVILSSIDTLCGSAISVIVPDAVVLIPLSLKLRGEGGGLGLGTAALGDGEAVEVAGDEPQADPIAASVTTAINCFKPKNPGQDRSRRYPSRLLEEHRASTLLRSRPCGELLSGGAVWEIQPPHTARSA